ncbi:hypothetical protein L6452_09715 [Arctium lappa]|uniref:Uncharacterized protein n=1 Tax=Arctium lappa TaxID=4217 RepID=A0ACB9DL25_ARCLA|nr:hypothetical protein L6452_09715 [Arctium lappa]
MNVSLQNQAVTVKAPTTINRNCRTHRVESVDLSRSPFFVSTKHNVFILKGCGNAMIMDQHGIVVAGCSTSCTNYTTTTHVNETNNKCFGISCCQTRLPYYMQSYSINVREGGDHDEEVCGSTTAAFLVDDKSDSKLEQSCCHQGGYFTSFPLDVGGGNSVNSWTCYTDIIYEGNPLLPLGCNGVGISMGILFLMTIIYALYKIIKKTKATRRRERFFKRNGGLLLKQQEEADPSLVDKTVLFTSLELEKATDNFNENRILGRGGQGTVYKGMLVDGRIVAIKKSKVVDESQLDQFINEVVILSQVNHRNVVKLLGCCLESEVPLLVSEFISNGTLYDRIHNEIDGFPISLNTRLQIATEVAGALAYLHSAASIPIYHRDIKTTNILLDDEYKAKVSDFGTSRFVSIDQTHLTTIVIGTFGYLDPEYFQSSQFTEKSDVYSFGVVLAELLTGERPIFLTRFGENISLATHFLLAMEEGHVMSIFDAKVIKEGTRDELLAVANLAMRCLNLNGKNRPTMKQVAGELEIIRMSHVPTTDGLN